MRALIAGILGLLSLTLGAQAQLESCLPGFCPPASAPLWATFDGVAVNTTVSGGALTATHDNSTTGGARTASIKIAGKYYYEVVVSNLNGVNSGLEMLRSAASYTTGGTFVSETVVIVGAGTPGAIIDSGTLLVGSIGAITGVTSIGVAVDVTNAEIWFRKLPAGDWNGDPTAFPTIPGSGVAITSALVGGVGAGPTCLFVGDSTETCTANFGQFPFIGVVPGGYLPGWSK